ncbi:MAG: hypothetical protein BWY91_03143 [bacterium ADurb.BinA028]|nr:MAG: hypothetical protein BWY91_03143 [bacterium ADurb.BinA028]
MTAAMESAWAAYRARVALSHSARAASRSLSLPPAPSSFPVPHAGGGLGAKTCAGSMPLNRLCIPPTGSVTDMGWKVSP